MNANDDGFFEDVFSLATAALASVDACVRSLEVTRERV